MVAILMDLLGFMNYLSCNPILWPVTCHCKMSASTNRPNWGVIFCICIAHKIKETAEISFAPVVNVRAHLPTL